MRRIQAAVAEKGGKPGCINLMLRPRGGPVDYDSNVLSVCNAPPSQTALLTN